MADKLLRTVLSIKADADLAAIWRYTADTWSPAQADKYIDSLSQTFDMLCAMPELAREHQAFDPPVRIYVHETHLIVYRVAGDMLFVVRLLGGRQDWRALLSRLDL